MVNTLYYVTARDAGRVAWLLGPYSTHAEALAQVQHGYELAVARSQWAHFYSFGTTSVTSEKALATVFGLV